MTAITGNTYPIRRELRAMGGEWDAAKKTWYVPDDRADEARSLLGTGTAWSNASNRGRGHGYRMYRAERFDSTEGQMHYGRGCGCIDYPCCGH